MEDEWKTTSGDSDGEASVSGGASAQPACPVRTVRADKPGRFNGRIHPTPVDGSCGAEALLAALKHLARSKGYDVVIPESAIALRQACVQHLVDN
jgi:hypothetical protein